MKINVKPVIEFIDDQVTAGEISAETYMVLAELKFKIASEVLDEVVNTTGGCCGSHKVTAVVEAVEEPKAVKTRQSRKAKVETVEVVELPEESEMPVPVEDEDEEILPPPTPVVIEEDEVDVTPPPPPVYVDEDDEFEIPLPPLPDECDVP